jgi:stage V sporulation protein G
MNITDIKVFPVREDKLKAFVSIILDDCFMVNDIKVIRGQDGMFISMPSRRKRNGKFKDIAHPLNNETRQAMEQEILAAYEAVPEAAEAPDRDESTASDSPRPEGRPRRRRRRSRRGPKRPSDGQGAASPTSQGGQQEAGGSRGSREPREPREPRERVDRGEQRQPAQQADSASRSQPSDRSETARPARAEESERSAPTAAKPVPPDDSAGATAEEVAEKHLSDSFWGT